MEVIRIRMDDWKIDIDNEAYLTKWNKEWARTFHQEKQGIIGSMIAEATTVLSTMRVPHRLEA